MKYLNVFIIIVWIAALYWLISPIFSNERYDMEKAYFEGQKDALHGDVRIKLRSDSIYIWIKSPWDSGRKPVYNPDYLDSNN